MNHQRQFKSKKNTRSVNNFLNVAYKDYLAARLLINARLLVQGAILASTSVEKYIKAISAMRGNECPGHLKQKHFNVIKNYDEKLYDSLNLDFLKLLIKVYKLRYIDNLDADFNLVIVDREFLAELDYTAIRFQECFSFNKEGQKVKTKYDVHKEENDSVLVFNNHILNKLDKNEFIWQEPQVIYEVRNCSKTGLIETEYLTLDKTNNGQFLREGWQRKDDLGQEYTTSFVPLIN